MHNLARTDPEVAEAIRNETRRQGSQLELIASENFVSEAVLEALGTVLTKKLPLPESKPMTAGASMAIGGVALLLLSAAFGELHPWPHISRSSALAVAYLITFGSLIAYTAYIWLLSHTPASKVASYAYVNPVVAVVLGYFFAGEVITPRMLVGAVLVLLSVYLILRLNRDPAKA